ncbi:unnamed protein product [Macrosiphum euphorbiae]|nr:unnamed protein product [Macrosiphum euphorbiae]
MSDAGWVVGGAEWIITRPGCCPATGISEAKLHDFNLVGDAACACGFPSGTAEHLLMDCPLADQEGGKTQTRRTSGRCGLAG